MTEVFLKLLNMSISAGWIVLAVMLLRLFLNRTPRYLFCLLWGIVALRLLIPFAWESTLSLIPSAEVIPQNIVSSPAIQSGIPALNGAINPILGEQTASGTNGLEAVLQIASAVWILGMGILLIYSAVSYWKLYRQVRASIPLSGNVYLCDDVQSPFILGILFPKIYLPSGMDQAQVQYVLAHENAHIKRRDHWWKPLGFFLLMVYWFHPLLWAAYILLCRDIECACDEKVVSCMDDTEKKGYSYALIACSAHRRMILACPVAFGEVGIRERIKGVLHYKKPAFWIIATSVALCLVTAVCFLTNPKPCPHTYTDKITHDASCTQTGVRTFTCQLCRYCYTEPIAVLPHSYQEGPVLLEPSCTQLGSQELQCKDCGVVTTQQLEKAEHTAAEPYFISEPNCTQTGEKSATCALCQTVFLLQVLETNDVHDLEETVIKAASCSVAGEGIKACSRCNYSEPCVYEQLAHTYVNGTSYPGYCTIEGSQQQICTVCGTERWLKTAKTNTHQWIDTGLYSPDICVLCYQQNPDSDYIHLEYSLVDDLFKPPKSKTPEDLLPVIRIWP